MNQQEIFDKVATHLIAQGKQSLLSSWWSRSVQTAQWNDQGCAYRGDDGTMCAAGCLIPDDEYSPAFEGMPWDCIAQEVPSFANEPQGVHDLIASLQGVHDDEWSWESPERLKVELGVVANQYGLSADVLC